MSNTGVPKNKSLASSPSTYRNVPYRQPCLFRKSKPFCRRFYQFPPVTDQSGTADAVIWWKRHQLYFRLIVAELLLPWHAIHCDENGK